EEAYFMEKGEIRFHGRTADLLERPDVLRSVFLEGATAGMAKQSATEEVPGGEVGPPSSPVDRAATGASEPSDADRADGIPTLELVGVTRSFGGIRAVDDVSLAVGAGEIVGIIG